MTSEQLFSHYELIDRKKDFEVIDFCEKYSLTMQNLDEGDNNKLSVKRYLLSDYGYALAKSGQSSKSIPILTEAIRRHEKHPDFEGNKSKLNGYQYIVFLLGESLYKTGSIEQSRGVFEKLLNLAPDNESYKSWIIETRNHNRKKIGRVAFVSFTVWLLISVMFQAFVPKSLDWLFTLTGLTLFITWTTVEVKSYLVKRKYK